MSTSNVSAIATMRPARGISAAGQAAGVARSVPALVVMADGLDPLTEPCAQWRDESLTMAGVAAQDLPLLFRRPAGLVQDLGADLELSDVMEERRPIEPVELVLRKAELTTEEVAVRAHALGVASRDPVVHAERRREAEEDLSGLLGRGRFLRLAHDSQALDERLDRSRA